MEGGEENGALCHSAYGRETERPQIFQRVDRVRSDLAAATYRYLFCASYQQVEERERERERERLQ